MTRPLHTDVPRRRPGPAPKQEAKPVWLKVYPTDWNNDAALKACSWAARGVWTAMVHLMFQCTPYGHLALGKKAMTVTDIARQLGGDLREIRRLVGELETHGVFSRTEEGVIYCRRMVRDHARSEEARRLGHRADKEHLHSSRAANLKLVANTDGDAIQLDDSYGVNRGDGEGKNAQKTAKNDREPPPNQMEGTRGTYSQNLESRIPPQSPTQFSDRYPQSLRRGKGRSDRADWKQELLKPDAETGRMICGRYYWDGAKEKVAEAAELPEGSRWPGNWEPLARWLAGSGERKPMELGDIVAAIRKQASWSSYEPPHSSLAMFNTVVCSHGGQG